MVGGIKGNIVQSIDSCLVQSQLAGSANFDAPNLIGITGYRRKISQLITCRQYICAVRRQGGLATCIDRSGKYIARTQEIRIKAKKAAGYKIVFRLLG